MNQRFVVLVIWLNIVVLRAYNLDLGKNANKNTTVLSNYLFIPLFSKLHRKLLPASGNWQLQAKKIKIKIKYVIFLKLK